MADVVTKFYYLEHGKPAPKNSEFKGIISTKSILGFKEYTTRRKSKELSEAAKIVQNQSTSFFDYTTKRFGATKTFSSNGWLDSFEKHNQFKNELSKHFSKDGDVLWTPVISLADFMTSTEMKLYNEEDYATIFSKILPSWFKQAGFKNDNMMWWMDYHVNTDNPHVHLNFLEKEKSSFRQTGKLPMKHINSFKNLFWKEVFAKKRYLEETGMSAKEGFKNKDLLKKETYLKFKEQLKHNKDEVFIKNLKSLYQELPTTGRLQYNATHMIPFRERLDHLVELLLKMPDLQQHYQKFMDSVKGFDEIRSKNMGTTYNTFTKQEDKKLRTMLANEILREYKNMDQIFLDKRKQNILLENEERNHINPISINKQGTIYLPVAKSLITKESDNYFYVRLPRKGFNTNAKYIMLEKRRSTMISDKKEFRVIEVDSNETLQIFNYHLKDTGKTIHASDLYEYFSEGMKYLNSFHELMENKQKWQQMREEKEAIWKEKQNKFREKSWFQSHDWKGSSKRIKQASYSWMHEIEQEVNQARNEYLYGKEFTI